MSTDMDLSDPFVACYKCKGKGGEKRWNNSCYVCKGGGKLFRNPKIKAAYKANQAQVGRKYIADNPWLVGVAFYYGASKNPVALTMLERAGKGIPPSESMVEMITREMDYWLKKRPIIRGKKVMISGEVLAIKPTRTGKTLKMLIRDDRQFTVWGQVPKTSIDAIEEGSRVKFTAKVGSSNGDDTSFGFFSHVSKLEIAEEAA